MFQQGDVIIEKVDNVPNGFNQKSDNHLAEGEATGHYHEALGGGVAVMENEKEMFLSAPSGCSVVHQEHGEITIPAGEYRVRRVQEYNHFTEEAHEVRD